MVLLDPDSPLGRMRPDLAAIPRPDPAHWLTTRMPSGVRTAATAAVLTLGLAFPAGAAEAPDIRTEPSAAVLAERRLFELTGPVVRYRDPRWAWAPAASGVTSAGTPASGAEPPEQPLRFDIPPGPLAAVVQAFERLTSLRVGAAQADILTLPSPGVTGVHTPEAALRQLLEGTAVDFRRTADGRVLLELRVAGVPVDVTGTAPVVRPDKFTAPLLDTPRTVTVIPRDVIEQQGATTLRDVLRNVPGITYQAGEGGGGLPGDSLTMRGFSATNDILVDGIRDVGSYSRDAFNLEQVEVLKGPGSAYSGRGSTGGSINLTTKSPRSVPGYAATFGGGSADYRRATVDLNQPLTDRAGGAALRLNGMWTDAGVPGRHVVENGSWALAPSFGVGLRSRTSLTASYVHLQQDNVPDYGLPWAAFDAAPAVDQHNFYGLSGYDFEDIDHDDATVTLAHQVTPLLNLRNVTRYGRTDRDSAITAPRPPNRQLQRRQMENEDVANQTALTGALQTGRVRHSFAGGVELIRETTRNRNSAQTTNQPQTDLYHPDPVEQPLGPMPDITGNPSRAVTGTVGVYLFDTASLTDRVEVNGGLRWDRSDVDYRLDDLATGARTTLGRTDRVLTWSGGVVVKPRPDVSVYASAGTSFNPTADAGNTGTSLSASATSSTNVNLEPERSRNVEGGAKWNAFGGRAALTAAVFQTVKTNARTRNANNEPFVLDGRQRVNGVELSVAGQVTSRWSMFAAFTAMDSRITASENPADVDGNLALVPKRSASLWTTYGWRSGLTLGGGAQFADSVYRNSSNTTEVPSYWLVNALAAYRVNEHLTLRANGTNLADRIYVDRVGGGHYIPGPRRALVVSTDVRF
jgi:catecholate siderophore receptor